MISPLGFETNGAEPQGGTAAPTTADDEFMGMDVTTELGVGEDDIHSLSGAVLGGGGGGLGGRQVSASDNSSATPAADTAAPPTLTGRLPMRIYLTCDDKTFTPYQVLVRKQIEFFETLPVDLDVVQGRNKPIQLGQGTWGILEYGFLRFRSYATRFSYPLLVSFVRTICQLASAACTVATFIPSRSAAAGRCITRPPSKGSTKVRQFSLAQYC